MTSRAISARAMLCICGLAIGTACVAGSAAPSDGPADRAPTTGAPTSEAPQRDGKPQPKATSNPTKVSERGEGGGGEQGDAGGGGEPNYGNALVVRARDFPDGLSGTIMCEGFVIPAGEIIILGDDLVVESSGPIIINGDLIGGAPWDGLDGVNIVLESTEFIRITGLVQPGDGLHGDGVRIPGGNGGDLVLRAPLTETTQEEFRAGDAGHGAVAANGGHGGSVLLSGQGVMYDLNEFPQGNPEQNFAVRGGNGGYGGAGTADFDMFFPNGADGGNGGDALALTFEPAAWMGEVVEARTAGSDGEDGYDDIKPLTTSQDGQDSPYPCANGSKAFPGVPALSGHGFPGGPGVDASAAITAGVGGRGGNGGRAVAGQGGEGGRGGDCCGPRPYRYGVGGNGGRAGTGGQATAGDGGAGGSGGDGHPSNPNGGHGGPGGGGGRAEGGRGGRGGAGGHGTAPGSGGTSLDTSGGAEGGEPGAGGPGGGRTPDQDDMPHGVNGAPGASGPVGIAVPGFPGFAGYDGLTCEFGYPESGGHASAIDPSGNNGTGQGNP